MQQLADDYVLVDCVTCNAIRTEEVHRIERVRLEGGAQFLQRGAVEVCAAVAVVNVLFDARVTRGGDLPLQFKQLTFNRCFFALPIHTHARVERCLCHTLDRCRDLRLFGVLLANRLKCHILESIP